MLNLRNRIMTSCGIRYISSLSANSPQCLARPRENKHIRNILLMPLVWICDTVSDSAWTYPPLCKSTSYPLIPTGPHMKNYSDIKPYGILKDWSLISLGEKDRKAYFDKKEIVKAFGIKRKQLEIHLRRHKDSIPVEHFQDQKDPKNRRTLIHVSILPYLIRCLTDSKKLKKEG